MKNFELGNIIENIHFGFILLENINGYSNNPSDFIIVNVNKALEKITGLSKDLLIKKRCSEINSINTLLIDNRINDLSEKAAKGESPIFDYYSQILKKWLRIQLQTIDQNHISLAISDITAEKIYSEQFDRFFSVDLSIFCIVDFEGNFITTNNAWKTILDFDEEDISGKKIYDFILPEDLEPTIKEMTKLSENKRVYGFVNRYLNKGGQIKYLEWNAHPYENSIYASARDVTERFLSRIILEESEKKYRTLFETMNQGFVFQDKNGIITSANLAAERILGLTLSQMQGRDSFDPRWRGIKSDGSDFPGSEHPAMMALKTGKEVSNVKMGVFHPQLEEYKWILINSFPQFNDNSNEPNEVFTTFEDITEIHNAEEKLIESNSYLENLFNYANAPIIVWDVNKRISRFNKAFEVLTDYSAVEVIGKRIDCLFPLDNVKNSLELIERTMKGERWKTVEIEILRKDGKIRTVLWNSANIYDRENNHIIATIAQGQDITERKIVEENLIETNQYLENLFNYANAPIIVWDLDKKITRFNQAFEALTDYSAYEMIGKDIEILFPAKKVDESLELIEKTMAGERWKTVEIEILRKDGNIRTVLWNSANIFDIIRNKVIATIAQGQDITERKNAEHHLKEYSLELEAINKELSESRDLIESNLIEKNKIVKELENIKSSLESIIKQKDKFFSIIAHDLRAPFNGFIGLTKIMAEDIENLTIKEIHHYSVSLKNSAENLFSLLENLLEWSRIQRGMLNLEITQININDLISGIIDLLESTAKSKQIQVVKKITDDVLIMSDKNMLNTIIRNLLSNAIKFTNKNGIVEIGFYTNKIINKNVLYVNDNGIGIPDELIDKLFIIGEKTSRKGTIGESSTGLGLILCKEYIEKLNGRIWVESKIGKGSTFYVAL